MQEIQIEKKGAYVTEVMLGLQRILRVASLDSNFESHQIWGTHVLDKSSSKH